MTASPTAPRKMLTTLEADLLDALQHLLEVHDAMGAGQSYAAEKARAAIAKAERSK